MTSSAMGSSEEDIKQKLLWNVKKEVKQIMEEAVTRKFVHEDSSHIIALCGNCYGDMSPIPPKAQTAHLQGIPDQDKLQQEIYSLLCTCFKNYLFSSSKYYEKEALMADPVCGPILASLLVGPCALEYTKLKTADHYWTDPSADELVQRHRIHGAHGRQDSPSKRPALGVGIYSIGSCAKEDVEAIPGYLSLHQSLEHLTLKWTPNQLMNGTLGDSDFEKSVYWDYALTVPISQIVCIHCHQQPDCGGTLVLVSQDGIQRPPLHFPQGGHLLAFLSCLENGLLPRGQLEPPLWSQQGKGKVFPKLRKRNSSNKSVDQDENPDEEIATDYVFRIIYPGRKNDQITINYHHLATSRSASIDDDEEEEDRLHAMISMICSRNLTAPNTMKDPNEMIEMQGFGSLLSWQLGEHCSHASLCLSCSTGSSPYDIPSCCSCIHDRTPLKMLCENMKRQILSRAFYGWLAYCRHLSTVRTHLSALVNHTIIPPDKPSDASGGLTKDVWSKYQKDMKNYKEVELLRLVYYGGVQHEIRKEVWPFLLGHYRYGMHKKEMDQVDEEIAAKYQKVMAEWKACEVIVKQREKETHSAIFAKLSSGSSIDSHVQHLIHRDSTISNDVFMSVDEGDATDLKHQDDLTSTIINTGTPRVIAAEERASVEFDSPDSGFPSSRNYSVTSGHSNILSSMDDGGEGEPSMDRMDQSTEQAGDSQRVQGPQDSISEDQLCSQLDLLIARESNSTTFAAAYTIEMLDSVALNLHRIDKDVQRCDRNYWYFSATNLEKLRNIMCSYVWEHLDVGYVQGMCDILAPLMVILNNEPLAYSCFTQLMKRMCQNFPNGGAMDSHFANMRSLIQILDSELFELMHQNGDYTHFYFCYRWFLLDFKRELLYEDVFAVWEVIWAAKQISSEHFVLFIALALVEVYREIIRDNNMDFTDIIKFFNEMAERHDAQQILRIARELVYKVQTLIENK
nr:PREDICTED: small G protein signaling modulator 2 [Latimeria chalumnae]|eukprot:XP_014346589.1 PREDICTED: small G protein signaling modulator 2 [Latimeria chalumnae]